MGALAVFAWLWHRMRTCHVIFHGFHDFDKHFLLVTSVNLDYVYEIIKYFSTTIVAHMLR